MSERQIKNMSNSKHSGYARIFGFVLHSFSLDRKKFNHESQKQYFELKKLNNVQVLEKLKHLQVTKNTPYLEKLTTDYEQMMLMVNAHSNQANGVQIPVDSENEIDKIAALGFQYERDAIQSMYETGRISRDLSKKMHDNISLLEIQV
ncbi:hypothetical protein [Leadbettera azotonutricia]|uniref:hypothetical protein n=1 Tax=Leadbettera azotonutricia TaxID=150829 RepID=UPI0011D2B1C2|nr:hypothetical protein [Leadbettera azotonutricia]